MRKNKSEKGIRPSQWGQLNLEWTDRQAFATRHSHQRVLHWWQRSLSSQGSLLAFKSPSSLGPESFTTLKAFGALPLREPSPWKSEVCSITSPPRGDTEPQHWDCTPSCLLSPWGFDYISLHVQAKGSQRQDSAMGPPIYQCPQSYSQVPLNPVWTEKLYKMNCLFSNSTLFFLYFWDPHPHSLNY